MAIGITGKFKPDGDFTLMDAEDIEMPDGTRLSEFDPGGFVVGDQPPENKNKLWVDTSDTSGDSYEKLNASLAQLDTLIGGDE